MITDRNLPRLPCHIFKMHCLLHCDGHYILALTEDIDVSMSQNKNDFRIASSEDLHIYDIVTATYTHIKFWKGCVPRNSNQIACV